MKRCCVILFLLGVLNGQAQSGKVKPKVTPPDSVQEVYNGHLIVGSYEYRNGLKNGAYSELFYGSAGDLIYKEEGKFKNGLKHGRADVYTKYDNYLSMGPGNHYVNGKAEGPNQFILSGDTAINGHYSNGQLNGIATYYLHYKIYDGTGAEYSRWRFLEECEYKQGIRHGVCVKADEYNEISEAGFYKDGLKDSLWRTFITYGGYKGEVMSQCTYVKGLRQGSAEAFYSPYNDTLDGDTIIAYRKINEYAEFKDGVLHGEYILSNDKGYVIESGNYVEGLRQGPWLYARQFGNEIGVWKGNVIDNKMEGEWTCADVKNRIRIRAIFKNDFGHGVWKFYNEKGAIIAEKLYVNNQVMSITNYEDLQDLTAMTILKLQSQPMHIQVKLEFDYRVSYETYKLIIGDTLPVLDSIAVQLFDMRNGHYNDSLLKSDGVNQMYSHDTLILVQNYHVGKLFGARDLYDYQKGVHVVNNFEKDSMISERFYTMDGKPFSGVYEMLIESPPNREVIRIRKGRRHGYTEYYGRLTGRFLGKVKF